jgi:cytochrome c oxidase cbb3-type subunit 3
MRISAIAIPCLLAMLATGCGHAPGYPPSPIQRPEQQLDFHPLYSANCTACHGVNGQGGPSIDLANPEYQALVDDASLRKWISNGMPGTEMPAFAQSAGGMLTDAQVNALIAGMRSEWGRPNAFAGATPPPYAQPANGDAHRGQQVYSARCASCHKSENEDITDRDYLALVGDQALRSIVIAGRPDIGQPAWNHLANGAALSAEDVTNLVAYLGSLRGPLPPTQESNPAPGERPQTSGQTGR